MTTLASRDAVHESLLIHSSTYSPEELLLGPDVARPRLTSLGEARPARALESEEHGGEKCACTSGSAAGQSTASVPSVAQAARAEGRLVAQRRSGCSSESTPSTGVQPAC